MFKPGGGQMTSGESTEAALDIVAKEMEKEFPSLETTSVRNQSLLSQKESLVPQLQQRPHVVHPSSSSSFASHPLATQQPHTPSAPLVTRHHPPSTQQQQQRGKVIISKAPPNPVKKNTVRVLTNKY